MKQLRKLLSVLFFIYNGISKGIDVLKCPSKHNGITLKDIQVWLGHSDFATTANIYSHLDASSKVSSLDTLSNIVSIE